MQLKDLEQLKVYKVTKKSKCGTLQVNDHIWVDNHLNCIEAKGFIPIADVQKLEFEAEPSADYVVLKTSDSTRAVSVKSRFYQQLMENFAKS